jgi:hypothetical protein
MAQAVSRLPLNADVRVRTQSCPCGVCGGLSVTGTGFSQTSLVFPVSIIPPWLYTHIIWGMNNRSVGGRGSEILSHPIGMKNDTKSKLENNIKTVFTVREIRYGSVNRIELDQRMEW